MWTFEEIYNGVLNNVPEADSPGLYKVFLPGDFAISFTLYTDATKDGATKPVELLNNRWAMIQSSQCEDQKNVLYIGQTTRALKKRLLEFAKHGYGEIKKHHGGYPIWQIPSNKKLLVEIYPDPEPEKRETAELDAFIETYGTAPVGNTGVGKGSKYKRKGDTYILR